MAKEEVYTDESDDGLESTEEAVVENYTPPNVESSYKQQEIVAMLEEMKDYLSGFKGQFRGDLDFSHAIKKLDIVISKIV